MTSKTIFPRRERSSSLTMHREQVLFVKMKDPLTGVEFLTPPGGGVEPGESLVETAIRETLEETGYQVALASHQSEQQSQVLDYDFEWKGKIRACRTTFFLCRLLHETAAVVDDASYNTGTVWVPLSEVAATLAYHPQIQTAVLACLARREP